MAHTCPDDRQSSHSNFTVTATLYIWVTQILKLCVEVTSPYEGNTSCPSFLQLLHPTSGLLRHINPSNPSDTILLVVSLFLLRSNNSMMRTSQ